MKYFKTDPYNTINELRTNLTEGKSEEADIEKEDSVSKLSRLRKYMILYFLKTDRLKKY